MYIFIYNINYSGSFHRIFWINYKKRKIERSEKTYGAAFVERLDDTKRPTTINSM